MKKLLVAVLAFALFAPAFAVENVYVTGDIQTIGLVAEQQGVALGTLTNTKGTTNRVLFGIGADLVEDVQAKLTFAHRNVFGDTGRQGRNLDNIWANTTIAEAYVKVSNVFDALEVKVGRQFYGDEKSAVMYFGPDYGYAIGNTYSSLDGVTARYDGENFALTAAYFSLANTGFTPNTDANIAGLDLDVKINDNIKANAYVYDVRERGAVDTFGFWGIKPTYENDNVKLGAEFTRNYGDVEKGWQVKADLALPIATDDITFTPRVTYLKSEKNFRAFGNYRPGLMFGTFLGIVNNAVLADWEIINAGLCMKFAGLEKWGFGLDFYTGERNDTWNGNSWEAKVVYNHNEYVAFNLTGAVLTNRVHFTGSPTAVQLGMNIKF